VSVLLSSLPAHAATLDLPAGAGAPPSGSILVDLGIDDASGILGTDVVVLYDPAVVEAFSVGTTALSSSHNLTYNLVTAGTARISLYGVTPLSGTGPLFEIGLTAVGPPGSFTPLAFDAADLNEGAIPAAVVDGGFCVAGLPAEVTQLEADLSGGSTAVFSWDPHPWAVSYNVYRGSDPALGDFACHASGVTSSSLPDDGAIPPPGGALFYLVTAATCAGDSSAGTTSQGIERILPAPCP
jgi:hypothetical protein